MPTTCGWSAAWNDLHLDGQRFTKHFSSRTVRDLSVIASTAPNNIWMSGNLDAVRWDGAGLVTPLGALAGASGMFFLDANERWAIGQFRSAGTGPAGRRRGSFEHLPLPRPIWGGAANDIWMSDSYLVHWNGATWTRMATVGDPSGIRAIFGTATNDVWAVGYQRAVWHYGGASWVRATLPFSNFSEAVNAGVVRAANNIWAVGDTGHVWHSTDGMTFSEATIGADVQLMGIASHRDGLFVVARAARCSVSREAPGSRSWPVPARTSPGSAAPRRPATCSRSAPTAPSYGARRTRDRWTLAAHAAIARQPRVAPPPAQHSCPPRRSRCRACTSART